MPSREAHVKKAERNQRFRGFLDDQSSYYDWAVVGLFYEAVHLVEAYAHDKYGADNDSHKQRKQFMSLDSELRRIFSEYSYLKDSSESARYGTRKFTSRDYQENLKRLRDVRTKILAELS